jgi:hypothetical protein
MPWWAESAGAIRWVWRGDPTRSGSVARAWVFEAPRVVPALHLAWLESHLTAPIEIGTVSDLEEVPGDLIVNCTGLGARQLCGDGELLAVFGQTVVVDGAGLDPTLVISDERNPDEMFYAIPVAARSSSAAAPSTATTRAPSSPPRISAMPSSPAHAALASSRVGLSANAAASAHTDPPSASSVKAASFTTMATGGLVTPSPAAAPKTWSRLIGPTEPQRN